MPSSNSSNISGLILSPTRELAMQISKEAQELTKFHDLRIGCFIGGTNMNKDISALNGGIDILVGTPGRLIDHLKNDTKNIQQRVSNLSTLVLDEADRLLDMGFKKEIETILSYLPKKRQTIMYSATFPSSVKSIASIALKPEHTFVDTIEEGDQQAHTHIPQEVMMTSMDTLNDALEGIITDHMNNHEGYKIMVFYNTARTAGFAAKLFQNAGFNVLEMHSRKSQSYRAKIADKFHKGKNIIMFCSDVSARGVDYPNVSLVVQVGLTEREQYIHRLGRTGRAGKEGRGVLLLCDFEKPFLQELKDLDIQPVPLLPTSSHKQKASTLAKHLPNDLELPAEQAYQAFLGYYVSNARRLKLNKPGIVQLAGSYSHTMGLEQPPKLQKRTIGKMGLKGIAGL